jgi:hypothetical protein
MAGEWVVGGVEAKDFAYVFVFLGLEAIVRNRWNRGLLLLGAAAAFHVVVGGWTVVAAGLAWLRLVARPPSAVPDDSHSRGRLCYKPPRLRSLWPGLLGGLLLALPGLLPSLALDWGVNPQTARQAHEIYVFERLPHHLVLAGMRSDFIIRFALLCLLWLLLGQWEKRTPLPSEQQGPTSRLRAFVIGAIVITLAGAASNLLIYVGCRGLAADLLRYYWFRLSDVMVPLAVALEGAALASAVASKNSLSLQCGRASLRPSRLRHLLSYRWLALLFLIAAYQIGDRSLDRLSPPQPRSHKVEGMEDFEDWRAACAWVANSGQIPPGACFLTPRMSHTFKWYTGHSEVATWKDIPQDAKDMVQWWSRLQELYATGCPPPRARWHGSLTELNTERLRHLGAKYGADYLITERSELAVKLPLLHRNEHYAIYRLR